MEFFNKINKFCENFHEVVSKILYSWENPMKFPFATVTDGYEEANFMGFSHYIYENELTFENMFLPMNLVKKRANFSSCSSK